MTPREANAVLATAGQFDGRKPDHETAITWADELGSTNVHDCIEAVKAHYRDTDRWIMPFHIIGRIKAIRQDRIERGKPFLTPPPELDALEGDAHTIGYARWEAGEHRKLADGADPRRLDEMRTLPPPEVRAALDALRKPPPAPDADTTEESA